MKNANGLSKEGRALIAGHDSPKTTLLYDMEHLSEPEKAELRAAAEHVRKSLSD